MKGGLPPPQRRGVQPKALGPKPKQVTEAEQAAQKRQFEYIVEDCKRICTADVHAPFTSLLDAVEKLLPFHVLASQEGDEADLEETLDAQGLNLLSSRRDAWHSMCLKKALEYSERAESLRKRVEALETAYSDPAAIPKEEACAVERLLLGEARELLNAQRNRSILDKPKVHEHLL